jgi:general secretion pathway protein B
MSFILDALRKSELERKRQTGPTLATAPEATRRPAAPWVLLALAVLLSLNLVGLLGFWIWRETRAPAPTAATAPPAERTAAAAPAAGGQRVVRPLAAEAATPQVIEALPEIAPPPKPALLPAAVAPSAAAAPPPATATAAAAAGATAAGATEFPGVPRIDQMSPAATAGLPELNMDLHVYQPDAARRFVFINGVRYGENATMKEGPTVERITRDGAVLNYRGVRFLIERP